MVIVGRHGCCSPTAEHGQVDDRRGACLARTEKPGRAPTVAFDVLVTAACPAKRANDGLSELPVLAGDQRLIWQWPFSATVRAAIPTTAASLSRIGVPVRR